MGVPHFGQVICRHGTPRWCGMRCPQFGHSHSPLGPRPIPPQPPPPLPAPLPMPAPRPAMLPPPVYNTAPPSFSPYGCEGCSCISHPAARRRHQTCPHAAILPAPPAPASSHISSHPFHITTTSRSTTLGASTVLSDRKCRSTTSAATTGTTGRTGMGCHASPNLATNLYPMGA